MKFSDRTTKFAPYLTAELKAKAAQMVGVADFTLGDPDYEPPRQAKRALIRDLRRPGSHRYQLRHAFDDARMEIAYWYNRTHRVVLDPLTQIEIGPLGSKDLGINADCCFVPNGAKVGCPNPRYPITEESILLADGIPVLYRVDTDNDLYAEIETLWSSHPDLVGIKVQFPHNPTTRGVDGGFYQWLVDFCRPKGLWIVLDNPYGYTKETPTILQARGAMECCVELNSISKRYGMQGYRFSWAAGCREMVGQIIKLHAHTQYGSLRSIQAAATAAIRHGDKAAESNCELVRSRLAALVWGLKSVGWVEAELPGSENLFAWVPLPARYAHLGSIAFCELLLEKAGVMAAPGIAYGSQGEGYVRFAGVLSKNTIRQACRRISFLFSNERPCNTEPVDHVWTLTD